MKKPARLCWNPAHRRLGVTCQRRAPAPLQDSVQASANLQPWTPSSTKRVRPRLSWAVLFFSFPTWFVCSSHCAVSPWIHTESTWEVLSACLPPSYLWKAVIRNRCLSLGFSSCTLFSLRLFTFGFYFQIIQIPRTSIKFLIIIPPVSSLPNYHCVSEMADVARNSWSGRPPCVSCVP